MAGENDKFEVYQDKRGEWRWRRKATNGQIVGAASEGYKSKSDCEANMNRGPKDSDKWEFYADKRGEHRWRAFASNGKQVGRASEGFSSKKASQNNARLNGWNS